ncbi:MAG: hypothetical protein ABEL76_07975 [Bradymonadaceae bacterium]
MRRLHAILLLGWHTLLHLVAKLTLFYDPGGLEQFRENFAAEGLASLRERERQALAEWQSCVGCGLCEAASPELSGIPENRHLGPSYMAQSTMRDLSESELAVPSVEALDDCDFEELEAVCPADVPLEDLADFLRRIARRRE